MKESILKSQEKQKQVTEKRGYKEGWKSHTHTRN